MSTMPIVTPSPELDDPHESARIAIQIWETYRRIFGAARRKMDELESIGARGSAMKMARVELSSAADHLRTAEDVAIGCLCHIGQRLTFQGVHYRAVPSRRTIKRTPAKRTAKGGP